MSTSIGIAVTSGSVRVIGVRSDRVAWHAEAEFDAPESLTPTLAQLFAQVPLARWPRPAAVAAIGPTLSQVKQITGLPLVRNVHTLQRVVQEGVRRFFLAAERTPLVSDVMMVEPGRAWAAAFDASSVHAVAAACRAARIKLRAVAPTVVVLARVAPADRIVWTEGPVQVEIRSTNGQLEAVRRYVTGATAASPPTLPTLPLMPAFDGLGMVDTARFADALGAALLPRSEPLVWRPEQCPEHGEAIPTGRLVLPAILCAAAVGAALLAPGLAALRAEQAAAIRLAAVHATRVESIEAERELIRIDDILQRAAEFDAQRRPMLLVLAALNRALPQGSALSTLHMDSVGGTLVVLTPRAASVLEPLENVAAIAGPEIVGPITRELVRGIELERVAVRFRFAAGARWDALATDEWSP